MKLHQPISGHSRADVELLAAAATLQTGRPVIASSLTTFVTLIKPEHVPATPGPSDPSSAAPWTYRIGFLYPGGWGSVTYDLAQPLHTDADRARVASMIERDFGHQHVRVVTDAPISAPAQGT